MKNPERSVSERLRRLRKDVPAACAAPGSVHDSLSVVRRRASRRSVERPLLEEHLAPRQAGTPVELVEQQSDAGAFTERVRRFPTDFQHGGWQLAEVQASCRRTIARAARDGTLGAVDLGRAVYLDIETTGLSGGAGTIPFMVGLGHFAGGDFELWQGFLRGPEEERALLGHVAERVAQADLVVSFFGKSFDRHRLEDKMRLHGVEPPFAGRPHLDLYYPLNRLYREAYADGRLQTLERALCAVEREDDLPGSHAPEAWFDFLAGRAHRLEAVFRHNQDDVLSLVSLAAHLGRCATEARAGGEAIDGVAAARARGWARLHAQARDWDEAHAWSLRARERESGDDRAWSVFHADLARRRGDPQEAWREYEGVARGAGDPLALHAWIQAAKVAEHDLRDLPRARSATREAHAIARETRPLRPPEARLGELERRLARLEKKLASADPAAQEAG